MEVIIPALIVIGIVAFLLTHKSLASDLKAKGSADLATLSDALKSAHQAISDLGESHATAVTAVAAQPIAPPAVSVSIAPGAPQVPITAPQQNGNVAMPATPIPVPLPQPPAGYALAGSNYPADMYLNPQGQLGKFVGGLAAENFVVGAA